MFWVMGIKKNMKNLKRTILTYKDKFEILNFYADENYDEQDESATDFAYALALCRIGYNQTEISQRIIAERQNWENHASPKKMENYLKRTIAKAFEIVAQI